jgi:hypothetical protein
VTTYSGYAAVKVREKVLASTEQQCFFSITKDFIGFDIIETSLQNVSNINIPIVQNISFSIDAFAKEEKSSLFNPFIIEQWMENPFKSNERLFPVDFGAPLEGVFMVDLSYPSGFEIANIPENALGLANNGARLMVALNLLKANSQFRFFYPLQNQFTHRMNITI